MRKCIPFPLHHTPSIGVRKQAVMANILYANLMGTHSARCDHCKWNIYTYRINVEQWPRPPNIILCEFTDWRIVRRAGHDEKRYEHQRIVFRLHL